MDKRNRESSRNEAADWVNSLVCVDKLERSIRVCLDPEDLNVAIKREHYPLPVVDDITTSCSGATLFSTLDAEKALYQIQLDEESSKLLTFNTPFGRYTYLRMPMGIKSAPEVYQQRMEQVFEGLPGLKVIMDDISINGRTGPEHDTRLRAVLQRSKDNFRLKRSKCHIQQEEVKFHGHLFSLEDVEWHWEEQQEASFKAINKSLVLAAVLGYYDGKNALTLQVDASSSGLGAALTQEDRPIAYASKALASSQGSHAMGFITDAEFLLLYEESKSDNLDFPYQEYQKFSLPNQNGAECTANLRVEKHHISRLEDALKIPAILKCDQGMDPEDVRPKLKEKQRKQKLQHDRKAKELPPLRDGEVVRVREGNKWKPARVTQVLPSLRSYMVETECGGYRRNRRHLLRTKESQIPEITPTLEVSIDEDLTNTEVEPASVIVAHENPDPVTPPTGMSMAITPRSGRTIREPQRFKDYVKY
ncbi:Uncharacterized protein K02A2.6 [Stylophora pistillata]|uniref:Uncharacterized protein K02A2.6 n=1 Tax=Stylophora pistillata TaxID=50429 RepID=A0A2B4RBM3_STYPI|nr:Uncharacterized protein K02A2.6 [Stylophora pistillata]